MSTLQGPFVNLLLSDIDRTWISHVMGKCTVYTNSLSLSLSSTPLSSLPSPSFGIRGLAIADG